jgi:small conductance mechanosensitive channel
VQIFNTILQTRDAKIVIIPNSQAIGDAVINYNMVTKKRIEVTVGISYSDSIDKAREVMHKVADESEYVLHDDGVIIAVKEL